MKAKTRKWLTQYFGIPKAFKDGINPKAPASNFIGSIERMGEIMEDYAKFMVKEELKKRKLK